MITYRYKLYRNKHNRDLDQLLKEACFVWNHCLALQKRYYRIYKQYIPLARMQHHFSTHYKMQNLHSQSRQEIIERLDAAYMRFFNHQSSRPPKFKRFDEISSIVFKQGGFKLKGNRLCINKLKRYYRFSLSRPYRGAVKRLSVKRSPLGEWYVCIITDAEPNRYGKSRNGASVGIDFGLKTYLTLSDGRKVNNPQFLKRNLSELRKSQGALSRSAKGSNHRTEKRKTVDRAYEKVTNCRRDWQWKLSHAICREYDNIYIEDLQLTGMCRRWGRKMSDLAHGEFVDILHKVADKYGCIVHKIDRWYPSSRMCECGYRNDGLKLSDRQWTCPVCGRTHDRDVNAAVNILRKGVSESESKCKSDAASLQGICVTI